MTLPVRFESVAALEDFMTTPPPELVAEMKTLDGDILVLGVGGKMGPTLARMARRAGKRVIGVARFSEPGLRETLEQDDVETISADLLDRDALERLPKAANVVFMAGRKFGATGDVPLTWAMNVQVPAMVAEVFKASRIVAFSTGCVYPFVPVESGGATEDVPPMPPPGDYATSCVGRERMFEYFSARHGTPGRLFRLNYAIDMRYGVLHDVGRKVRDGETIEIRWLAGEFGKLLGRTPTFSGKPAPTGWLNNAGRMVKEFGTPSVPLARMIEWTADWLSRDMATLDKPTHYEVRDGKY